MIKDVFSAENASVDIQKMRPIHKITGSQKRTNRLNAMSSFNVLHASNTVITYDVPHDVQALRRL
ncbi:MAG: hypothetical protein ABR903_08475 [Thermodesulfovibrionales bacterium]